MAWPASFQLWIARRKSSLNLLVLGESRIFLSGMEVSNCSSLTDSTLMLGGGVLMIGWTWFVTDLVGGTQPQRGGSAIFLLHP